MNISIATNFSRVGISNEEFLSIKSPHDMVLQNYVECYSYCLTTTTRTMANKLGKILKYYKMLQSIKSHNPSNTWYVKNKKQFIYTTTVPIATKPDSVVTYNEEPPS